VNMDLTFALLWMGIAGVHFYRFFRRNVDWAIYLGILFLSVGIAHLVSYARLAHH